MQEINQNIVQESGLAARFIVIICFCLFGILGTYSLVAQHGYLLLAVGALQGLVFAFLAIRIMTAVVSLTNRDLQLQYGKSFAGRAVAYGMAYMLPFAILAVIADRFLHWPGVTLFTATGIMATGSAIGAEISKAGKVKVMNYVLPSIIALIISIAWMTVIIFINSISEILLQIIK
ncbi:MAG: hypothetical protein WCP79_15400 [Bacillota bacterium]